MSNSNEELKKKNKLLVDEAFRVTKLHNQAKNELEELKKKMETSGLGSGNFFGDRIELRQKLKETEAALIEKTETNKKLAQFLNDADRRADEARKTLLVTQNILLMKEQEIGKLAEQLEAKEALKETSDRAQQLIAEAMSQLHAKETELAIVSTEMVTGQKLLGELEQKVEKLHKERALLFSSDSDMKMQDIINQNEIDAQLQLAEKENEIAKFQMENQRLSSIIYTMEGELKKNRGLEMKVRQLESQLDGFFREQVMRKSPPPITVVPSPQPTPTDYSFMSLMMDNMKQMQMEIQRLKNQQDSQFNH